MSRGGRSGALAAAVMLWSAGASAQVGELPAEPPAELPAEPAPARASAPGWPAFALAGVAGGGAVLGTVLTIVGLSEEASVAGLPCPGGPDTCSDEVTGAVAARNGLVAAGTTSFVVSGAAVIGLVTYLAVGRDADPPVDVVAGPAGATLSARLRF